MHRLITALRPSPVHLKRMSAGWLVLGIFLCALTSGCAAITNPVANGLPVRRMPVEFKGESREEQEIIELPSLGQRQPDAYLLAPGDVLGIWIEGVLGEKAQQPPVQYTETGTTAPGVGYPIPVRENGTIPLPLVEPIKVQGLTLEEAENEIRKAYTVTKKILRPGEERVIVTLLRPRLYHVLVIRQDAGGLTLGGAGNLVLGSAKRGTGHAIDLPAYQNDVLNALAKTGGMPGLEAENEVIIFKAGGDKKAAVRDFEQVRPGAKMDALAGTGRKVVRIPLRLYPGTPLPFKPEDVLLESGDIVYIEARDSDLYYTGGLLPTAEHSLPRDYDLDVLEAVARVGGPLTNGGIGFNNLSGNFLAAGIGFPSPSQLSVLRRVSPERQVVLRVDLNRALRDPRERILVQRGDVLILQESPGEAFGRYLSQVFNFNALIRVFDRGDATGTATVTLP